MAFRIVRSGDLEWDTRPHEPGGGARHVAQLTELAGFGHSRANYWRFEPGAKGRRHRDLIQEETFVPVRGTLTMYLGEPPERLEASPGELIHVEAGTALQVVNEGNEELLLYIYGAPPERGNVELLDSAV